MKKLTVVSALVLSLMLLFAGCGGDTVSDVTSDITSGISSTVSDIKSDVESGLMDSDNMTSDNGSYSSNSSKSTISRDEAKKIAYKHAKVDEKDAYDVDVDLDRDNGTAYYDVDFETKTHEYDYEINAYTGEIIISDKEAKTNTTSR